MKLSNLLLTTSLVALTALPASAQGRGFNSIDSDADGLLSLSELEAAFGAAGAERILLRSDSDGDGALTRREIRSSQDDEDDDDDDEDDEDNDESDDEDNDESDQNDESDDNDDSDESGGSDNDENDDE